MLKFFFKVFVISFTAIAFSWLLEGSFYTFYFSRAQQEVPVSQLVLPQPVIVRYVVEELARDSNFLLLGMSGKPYAAPLLTDTIIVGTVRTDPLRVSLTSLPRDLFVQVPGGTNYMKINSLYSLGHSFSPLEPEYFIKQKVEEITGLPIDYFAVIDIVGLEQAIDFLGGVDIEVIDPIYDPFFPGPNYSYQPFYLEAGMQHLSGHDAVRFARSRYAPRGDFERIARQQQLLGALKDTIAQEDIPLDDVLGFMSDLEGHLFTNVTLKDIPMLLSTLLNFEGQSIQSFTLDNGPGGLLHSTKSEAGAYILLPNAGLENYQEIQEFFTLQDL